METVGLCLAGFAIEVVDILSLFSNLVEYLHDEDDVLEGDFE